MIRPIPYVAGHLRSDYDQNREIALRIGAQLIDLGYAPIIPHTMFAGLEHDPTPGEDQIMEVCLSLVRISHLIVLTTPNWTKSAGTCKEVALAREYGIPIFGDISCVPRADHFEMDCQSIHIDHLLDRIRLGVSRYGRRLYPFNGKDAAQQAYEETMDNGFYACQMLEERNQSPLEL